jgi:glyoxylase-like metal-dependent hydrolase (beta-lactamase superfamily II)
MLEIAPKVYVETRYPGVNVGVIVTEEGNILIDTPSLPRSAYDWQTRVTRTTKKPIRYLVLTDYHTDRSLTANQMHTRVIAHEESHSKLSTYDSRFPAPVLDNVAARYDLSRKELNGNPVVLPQITFCHEMEVHLGGRIITFLHRPSATPGSLWVLLRQEKVLFSGDTLVVDHHPPLSEARTDQWMDALIDLETNHPNVETIVPGRGPLCDRSAIPPLKDYLQRARSRVHGLYIAGRPRADTTSLIPEFLSLFPPGDASEEWIQRQLKAGLDHIYDEFKAFNAVKEAKDKV